MGQFRSRQDLGIHRFDDTVQRRQDRGRSSLATQRQRRLITANFLPDHRQPNFIAGPQDLLGKVIQTQAHPAAMLQSHPGMTPVEVTGSRDLQAEDFLKSLDQLG